MVQIRHTTEASPLRASARALPRLPQRAGFWAVAFSFLAVAAFSTAPSSLYGLYEQQEHLSSLTITIVYAVYAIGIVVSLLLAGHVSDWYGPQGGGATASRDPGRSRGPRAADRRRGRRLSDHRSPLGTAVRHGRPGLAHSRKPPRGEECMRDGHWNTCRRAGTLAQHCSHRHPRIVARHNHPEDDAASRAYLASTGRWAGDRAGQPQLEGPPDSDAEPWQADGTDSGEASLSTAGYRAGSLSA